MGIFITEVVMVILYAPVVIVEDTIVCGQNARQGVHTVHHLGWNIIVVLDVCTQPGCIVKRCRVVYRIVPIVGKVIFAICTKLALGI